VTRTDDNARRHRPPAPRPQLPQALSGLVHQARQRGVRLLIMPPGMQRRRDSSTYYHFRARKLLWRVEWCFPEVDREAAAAIPPQQLEQQQPQPQRHHQQQRWQPQLPVKRPRLEPQSGQQQGSQAQQQAAAAGTSSGGGETAADANSSSNISSDSKGLVMIDAQFDEDKPLRELLESHLADAPGLGARRLALRAYTAAVAEAGGDLSVLPVLMRQEQCPVRGVRVPTIQGCVLTCEGCRNLAASSPLLPMRCNQPNPLTAPTRTNRRTRRGTTGWT